MILLDKYYRYYTNNKFDIRDYIIEVANIEEVKRLETSKWLILPKKINLCSYNKKQRVYFLPPSFLTSKNNRQFNLSVYNKFNTIKPIKTKIKLRQRQKDVSTYMRRLLATWHRSLLIRGKPWVGKTTAISNLIYLLKKPAVIVTPTQKIRSQFYNSLLNFFNEENVYEITTKDYDSIDKQEVILCMTYSSFNKLYDKLNWNYPVLIIDEAHNLPKSRIAQINQRKNRLLVIWASATPYRQEIDIQGMRKYRGNIFEVPEEEVKKYTVPVKVFHYIIKLNYSIDDVLDKDIDLLQPKSDRQLFYEDKRLYKLIQDIVDKLENEGIKKILILTEQTKQIEYLLNYLKSNKKLLRYDWKMNKKTRSEIENEFKNLDEFIIVANEKAVKEGFDLPALEAGILAYPTKRRWAIEQAVGRVQRISNNKEYWIWVDVDIRYSVDNSKYKIKAYFDRKKHYEQLWFQITDM